MPENHITATGVGGCPLCPLCPTCLHKNSRGPLEEGPKMTAFIPFHSSSSKVAPFGQVFD